MTRLVLLGAPGSGKGTQGPPLARYYGVPHLSSGELLRREVEAGTALGHRVAAILDQGDLVPDEVIQPLVAEALTQPGAVVGYVLDGFPRTVAQAEWADDHLFRSTGGLNAAVYLDLPDEVTRRRLAGRAGGDGRSGGGGDAGPGGRGDDTGAVVERRLRLFHAETAPLVDHYRRQGLLTSIDATPPPDRVTKSIIEALAARGGGRPDG